MKYPNFTGWEPCAQTDPYLFTGPDDFNGKGNVRYDQARAVCEGCLLSTFTACKEWAVLHEAYGFWAGTTPREREAIRRERGIECVDPSARPYVRVVSDPLELHTVAL